MSVAFKPRMDILPAAQQHLWPALRPLAKQGFALYGGTAIALRLGHRSSIDFDFFSAQPLDRKDLQASLPFLARSTILQEAPHTLSVTVSGANGDQDQVKVSFFGGIDLGRIGQPDVTEDGVLQIASSDDLMATKLKVILQRVEAKDYRDIAALIAAGTSLSRRLAAARALYGRQFQPSESLKALVYFEGGDLDTILMDERAALIEAASKVRELIDVRIVSQQLVA